MMRMNLDLLRNRNLAWPSLWLPVWVKEGFGSAVIEDEGWVYSFVEIGHLELRTCA